MPEGSAPLPRRVRTALRVRPGSRPDPSTPGPRRLPSTVVRVEVAVDAEQFGGLDLVDDEHVDRIQDAGRPPIERAPAFSTTRASAAGRTGDDGFDDGERHLELQDDDVARREPEIVDDRRRPRGIRSGDDDDRVLAALVDRDEGRAGGPRGRSGPPRRRRPPVRDRRAAGPPPRRRRRSPPSSPRPRAGRRGRAACAWLPPLPPESRTRSAPSSVLARTRQMRHPIDEVEVTLPTTITRPGVTLPG